MRVTLKLARSMIEMWLWELKSRDLELCRKGASVNGPVLLNTLK